MKTIEIKSSNYRSLKRLAQKLSYYGLIEHFLFEPNLIVRTKTPKEVIFLLKKYHQPYRVYSYPFTKRGFGESRRYKKLLPYLKIILKTQSLISVSSITEKQKGFLANRMIHCFLNMEGFDHYDESKLYLSYACSYMKHDYRANGKLTGWILYNLMAFIEKLL